MYVEESEVRRFQLCQPYLLCSLVLFSYYSEYNPLKRSPLFDNHESFRSGKIRLAARYLLLYVLLLPLFIEVLIGRFHLISGFFFLGHFIYYCCILRGDDSRPTDYRTFFGWHYQKNKKKCLHLISNEVVHTQ